MYRPDSTIDYVIALSIMCALLPIIALMLFRMGRQQSDGRFALYGAGAIGGFLISVVVLGMVLIVGVPQQDEGTRHQDMAESILKKYNHKYYPDYLRQVEFAQSAGAGETGDFFTLTYNDYQTETRRFYFDSSGNPSCNCTLYQPER